MEFVFFLCPVISAVDFFITTTESVQRGFKELKGNNQKSDFLIKIL